MSYITVQAKYENGVVTPLEKIKNNPTNVVVIFEYQEVGEQDNYKSAMDDYKWGKNTFEMKDIDLLMKKRWIIR